MSEHLVTNSAESTELRVRLITASVLLPIAILVSFAGGELFFALILPVMAIGMLEFYVMEKDTETQGSSLTGIPTGIAVVSAILPGAARCLAAGAGALRGGHIRAGIRAPPEASRPGFGAGGHDALRRRLCGISSGVHGQHSQSAR